MRLKLLALFSVIALGQMTARAQEAPLDTLTNRVNIMNNDLTTLKKIKMSGYVQSQFQFADSAGVKSFAGGDFGSHIDKRFKVRRAEFKTMYDNGKTQIVANIDITQGGVLIKDAYGKFTEQWMKAFTLTTGIFNRPFGWEVPNSSSLLESPERSRFIQIIFPGERDLGAMLTFQMPVSSKLHPLKIEGGMFNGSGNRADDFDYQKDFIGNIHWNNNTQNQKISFGIGASFYNGGWRQGNDTTEYMGDVSGSEGFIKTVTKNSQNEIILRQYTGFDAQFSIEEPLGVTTIRGEYLMGTQPGTSGTTTSPSAAPLNSLNKPAIVYRRRVMGYNVFFLQNVGKTPLQLAVKYDAYDPNTQVAGMDIVKTNAAGKSTGLTSTDIAYTTLGLGLIYHWDQNVKITAYYDMVTNEATGLTNWTKDLNDNVWTFRVQYKF